MISWVLLLVYLFVVFVVFMLWLEWPDIPKTRHDWTVENIRQLEEWHRAWDKTYH